MNSAGRTNVLGELTNDDLIEHVNEDPESSEAALELAERLQLAIGELDRMVQHIRALGAKSGTDT